MHTESGACANGHLRVIFGSDREYQTHGGPVSCRAVKLTAQIGEVEELTRKLQNVEAQCEATLMMVTTLQATEAANAAAAASGKKGKKR
eukprot:SAG31_NODE_1184_length_9496_cov_7.198680_9_plen_89_part_00